jgi:anion-transporting  ArsA/GET3 family ATPase
VPPVPHLDHRLVVVTGKGGTGKSTVAAALALIAARRGKRVLVAEVNATERVAPLLGAPPAGPVIREARPGISTVDVTPPAALREYGLQVVKLQVIYDAVFENRLVRHFLRVVPGLGELVMLGKILHEARAEERGRPRWDQVIVDAPATGHALQMLGVPGAMLGMVPAGPLRSDAQWMQALLTDPARTAALLVTLPEEMPITEAIELDQQLRDRVGITPAAVLVNAMPARRFTPAEAARLGPLGSATGPVGPAAQAARLQTMRGDAAQLELARLQVALPLPIACLPLLATPGWGLPEVTRIADVLDGADGSSPWLD